MRHSWFIPVLLVLTALAGYAALRPLKAQANPFPFAIGDTVRFTRPDNGIQDCRIAEIRQTLVRCGRDPLVTEEGYWINPPAMLGFAVKAAK